MYNCTQIHEKLIATVRTSFCIVFFLHGCNGGILFCKILLYKYVCYIMSTVLSSFTMYCTLSMLVIVFYNDISLGCNSSLTNYVSRRVDMLRTRQLHTNFILI